MKTKTLKFGKVFMVSFLTLGLALSSCKKDEKTDPIPTTPKPNPEPAFVHVKKQVPIIYKSTGETCYYCGDWGWQAWIDLSNDFKGTAFAWANYSTGFSNGHFRGQELTSTNGGTPAIQAIKLNFGSGGKPNFYTNGHSHGTSSSAAKSAATASIANTNVDVSVAMLPVKWDGDKLTVKAEVKLYENLNGKYYMNAYVIENKAKGPQSGPNGGTNVEHHLVMRGSMTAASPWGLQIIDGAVNSGAKFAKTFECTIPSSYKKENITVGVVFWKKQGTYRYVNAITNQK